MTRTLKFTGISAAALLTGLLFFSACKKETQNTDDTNAVTESQMMVQDDAEANMIYDDVFTTVVGTDDEVGIGTGIGIFGRTTGTVDPGGNNSTDTMRPCFTITRVPNTPGVFPKTVTIDFGTGCTGTDGRTRKGKIVTVYTGRLAVAGNEATTTFVNYFVDSLHIEGTVKVKNNSTGVTRVFTRTVIAGKITHPGGNYIQWNATHTNTQTSGSLTPLIPLDDEFDITGTATGQNFRRGISVSWSHVISNPLHKKFTCRWLSSGTITFTRNSLTATLDYGNGSCDNTATITIFGRTYVITLN